MVDWLLNLIPVVDDLCHLYAIIIVGLLLVNFNVKVQSMHDFLLRYMTTWA